MKADEPGPRVVKYGMAEMEKDKLVERHFAVTQEERAITAFHVAHTLLIAPWLRNVLRFTPEPEQAMQPAVKAKLEAGQPPNNLRKSLGLS